MTPRTEAERVELDISYQLYAESYDTTLDDRPVLSREEWERIYGDDILREARQYGHLDTTQGQTS